MCDIYLEPCEVWVETHRKARKEHECSCCFRKIVRGETYLIHFDVFEGRANSRKMCQQCEADRKEFADDHDSLLCDPSYFPEMLGNCIGDDGDDKWRLMLDRIRQRA